MKIEYKKDYRVAYTDVDSKAQLSLISCLELAQDMVTDYFRSFKNDNLTLTNKYNAVWVYSKTKVHFWKKPIWRDELNIRTVASKIKPITILYNGLMKDLYPDLDLRNHWNENVLSRMKKDKNFGMEENEPMCKNELPREGIVLRINDDPVAEAFKLKCLKFLGKEAEDMDKGVTSDYEMQERYGEENPDEN